MDSTDAPSRHSFVTVELPSTTQLDHCPHLSKKEKIVKSEYMKIYPRSNLLNSHRILDLTNNYGLFLGSRLFTLVGFIFVSLEASEGCSMPGVEMLSQVHSHKLGRNNMLSASMLVIYGR